MLELLDPTLRASRPTGLDYAKRPATLAGKRIGLVENTKVNAADLLQRIGDILVREHGAAETKLYRKKHASTPVHDAIIEDIWKECDVVIVGIGDCGSCSSATVLDGIMIEKVSRPAASIVTNYFVNTGRAMAKQWGVPDYKFVVARHPVANLSSEDLEQLVRELVDGVLERLLAQVDEHQE